MMPLPVPVPVEPAPFLPSWVPDPRGLGALMAQDKPLPLAEVRVRAEIVGSFARTVVEQRFENPYDQALEVVHIFPLPPDGAVVELELLAGDKLVRGECRERKEARASFDAAREAGHRAALLEAERADVHTLRVTNIPPKTPVSVRLVIVEVLTAVDGRLTWRFPTTVAPRYTPGEPTGHEGLGVMADTDAVPDASRISPPLRLSGGTRLDLEVRMAGPVTGLSSSLHAVRVDLEDGGIRVAPSARTTLNRDFVLAFTTADPDWATARAWTDGRFTAVLVEPPAQAILRSLPRDAVFVVDISGSMAGPKMEAAKKALQSALHGLVSSDRFRLIAFDNEVDVFRPGFVSYDDVSLAEADRWIEALDARGGTEMLPAVEQALDSEPEAGRVRTVLLITDGQSTDEARLVPAVANRRNGALVFTLGIDTAVNESLLKRLARVGGGTCELCTPHDDIEAVVARLEARFGSPLATGVTVEGGAAARPEPAVLFAGRPVTLLVEGAPPTLQVKGELPGGNLSEPVAPSRVETPLGALWARERVAWLEDRLVLRPYEEEAIRPEILRIALEHRIASRFTSFVAVDETMTATGERVEVVQPVEGPADWDLLNRGVVAAGVPPSPAPAMMRRRLAAPAPTGFAAPVARVFAAAADLAGADFPDLEMLKTTKVVKEKRASAILADFEQELGITRGAPEEPSDPAGTLARTQGADGSYGGDLARTAAALLALVVLGHTRRSGTRQRVVLKAAAWLDARRKEPLAALVLGVLKTAEQGEIPKPDSAWEPLYRAGTEGAMLRQVARA
ncbi:MAG TPA: VIT domain-containing protein [Thermoanaerobaculia bacterium]|nr:VIT domain-containing protein [Thermoanaerobaculia bacterium]